MTFPLLFISHPKTFFFALAAEDMILSDNLTNYPKLLALSIEYRCQ